MRIAEVIENGMWDVFRIALNNPMLFNLREVDDFGNTLIHILTSKGKVELVQKMLTLGTTSVNAANIAGETALHLAADCGDLEMLKVLLEHGADVEVLDTAQRSPLFRAVLGGHLRLVQKLREVGSKTDVLDASGESLVHAAVRIHSAEILKYLLSLGVDVNLANASKETPLRVAIITGMADIAACLIGYNAKVTEVDVRGRSLLHLASSKNDCLVGRLVLKQLNVNIRDCEGATPLHLAAEFGCLEMIKLLLNKGADVNAQDADGYTALHISCSKKNLDILKFLIYKGASLSLPTCHGNYPLHIAASHDNQQAMNFILECEGFKHINTRNNDGQTLAHCAAERASDQLFSHLVKSKFVDLTIVDGFGKLAHDYANPAARKCTKRKFVRRRTTQIELP